MDELDRTGHANIDTAPDGYLSYDMTESNRRTIPRAGGMK